MMTRREKDLRNILLKMKEESAKLVYCPVLKEKQYYVNT